MVVGIGVGVGVGVRQHLVIMFSSNRILLPMVEPQSLVVGEVGLEPQ